MPKKQKTTLIVCCSVWISLIILTISAFIILWLAYSFRTLIPEKPLPNISKPEIQTQTQNHAQILDSQKYKITEKLTLKNTGTENSYKQIAIIPKFHDIDPYQYILEERISPSNYEITTDKHGNEYLNYAFDNLAPKESRTIDLEYKIKINHIKFNLSQCQGKSIGQYLSPDQHIESNNPQITALAQKITQNSENQCQASESIYNWISNNITYPQYFPQAHGALWALQNKQGDCTEFSDLFIALNRASDIPARFVEGLAYTSNTITESSQLKHDWSEVYLPNIGWVPVDSTWGRFQSNRNKYFAQMPANHAILTIGRNLETIHNYYFYYYEYFGSTVTTQQESWQMQKIQPQPPIAPTKKNIKSEIIKYFYNIITKIQEYK